MNAPTPTPASAPMAWARPYRRARELAGMARPIMSYQPTIAAPSASANAARQKKNSASIPAGYAPVLAHSAAATMKNTTCPASAAEAKGFLRVRPVTARAITA